MIFNLTPHPINICDVEGNITKTIPNCGWELRLSTTTEVVDEYEGVTITKTVFGEPTSVQGKSYDGQVNPWENVHTNNKYIVSQLVKNAYVGHVLYDCLLVPAEVVRDSQGNILGCKSLGV
jgi:hypothetical protein